MPSAQSEYIIERAIFYHTSELFKLSKRGAVIFVSSKLMLTEEDPSSSAIDEDLLSKRRVLTSRLAHILCVFGLSLTTGCSKLFDIFASVQPVAEHFFGGGDATSTMTEGCSMDSQESLDLSQVVLSLLTFFDPCSEGYRNWGSFCVSLWICRRNRRIYDFWIGGGVRRFFPPVVGNETYSI